MNVTRLRCIGLSLVVVSSAVAQVSTSCIPTKNQVVLRQRVAELDAAQGRLDTRILQAEVDALTRRGMIDEQQAAEFAAIIDHAQAPKGPLDTPEGAALARQALAAKVSELESAGADPIPESNPEMHARASAALESALKELEPGPSPEPPDYSARQAVAVATLATVMTQMSAATSAVEDDSDEAIAAKAQAALAAKMAELDHQATPPRAVGSDLLDPEAQTAAQQALAEKMAELDRQAAEATQPRPAPELAAPRPAPAPTAAPPRPAPVVVTPAPVPAPVVVTPAPAPPPVVVAPAPAPAPPVAVEAVVAPGEDRNAAAAAALAAKMTDLNRQENVSITGVPVQPPPVPPGDKVRAEQLMRETVAAPFAIVEPKPASKTGWERLNELTDLYRSNQMTPREYHAERAKLMESLAR
jgi:hypothetical protein